MWPTQACTIHVDARWTAGGTKSMAFFLEKPVILFTMIFDLGTNTLLNITTKLSFSKSGVAARGVCSAAQSRGSSR